MLRFSLGLACASLWIALGPLPTVLAAPLFTKAYIQRRTDANLAVLQVRLPLRFALKVRVFDFG
jgi:hypothetical protein